VPPPPPPPPVGPGLDRRRNPLAVVAAVAVVVAVGLAVVSDRRSGSDPPPEPAEATTTTAAPEPEVVALREGPWLAEDTGLVVTVVGAGGRLWLIDVDGGRIDEHRVVGWDEDRPPPVAAVVDGHLISHWDQRLRAAPLSGGPTRDLGPIATDVPRTAAFPSARPRAVWVAVDHPDEAGSVVMEERTVDGEVTARTTTAFPRFDPPFADVGPPGTPELVTGAVIDGQGVGYVAIDVATGGSRPLVALERPSTVLAAGGGTLAVVGGTCDPGCDLVLVDVASGEQRRVPPPEGAGARLAPGSVAPGGAHLVHVASSTDSEDPRNRYVVTDVAAGRSRVSEVAAGPGVAWAPDGSRFAASPRGVGGDRSTEARLVVHHVVSGETFELPVRIRIPSTMPWQLVGG
jgi:hypothetical protein